YTISPLLGVDVQEKGKTAIIVAAVVVVGFMLVYYWMAGLIANLSLVLNVILILGAMALFDATFTLPGLAGLVLTIGMAVDANVLIFERMREELAKGASLRMAIHNGFSKAFSTIIDANLTTLITAVILYSGGTEQVKGFAALLFIGILMSMFSALYFGRLMFDMFERLKLITPGNMLGWSFVRSGTAFDFMGKQKLATVLSLGLILGGMAVLFSRGNDNLDIDFTGGSMVTFQFQDNPGIDEARASLEKEFGNDLSLERLVVPSLEEGGADEIYFRLRTKDEDTVDVRRKVNLAFENSGHELTKVTMEFGEPTEIPKAAEGETSTAAAPDFFAGGTEAVLSFSGEVTTSTVQDLFLEAYAGVTGNDALNSDETASLISLVGTAGSGVDAKESSVKRFSQVKLQVRPEVSKEVVQQSLADMQQSMTDRPILDEVNTFSSAVAGEAKWSAIKAILLSLAAIIAYVWFRFTRLAFGLAAVVALIHDVLCVLGLVAIGSVLSRTPIGPMLGLVDFKINLPMIAAFLTIIGYSLNDTIVVFDRIREVRGKNPNITREMIDASLNQTLARTLLTSATTLIVVIILYLLGGEGLHGFAYCLLTGIVVGTYSSIYVASPILLLMTKRDI
ncbi:MAG: protein translocase subunit SecF, partial [Planctomycetaceae bacterium]|nr:protein translocase subunit SecF [Planctomycetaceae bacterium]